MKFEIDIDISHTDVAMAASSYVKDAIKAQTYRWMTEKYIADRVKELWDSELDKMIKHHIADSPALEGKIRQTIQKKLRAKISALMNSAENNVEDES